jgi:hypothetical protein
MCYQYSSPNESALFVGTEKSLEELKNPLTYSDWNFERFGIWMKI